MAYSPPDCEELFRDLGPKKTLRGIINGYFDPDTAEMGRVWLTSTAPWKALAVSRSNLFVGAGGLCLALLSFWIGQQN